MLVVGLDLSIRCTGMVALPSAFARTFEWSAVRHRIVESKAVPTGVRERTERLVTIAEEIAEWVSARSPDVIALEEQAFNQGFAHSREIGELTGIVKARLLGLGVPIVTVPATTARKTLLGKVPRKGSKDAVSSVLRRMGAPWTGTDRSDAFAIANHVLSTHGHPAVTVREAA